MKYRLLVVAISLTALLAVACDESEEVSCPPIVVVNPDGLDNGWICNTHDECKYGICYRGELTEGGPGVGFCTKLCDCGEGSNCADDGGFTATDPYLKCQRPSGSANEPLKAFCAPQCYSLADCARYGDAFTSCAPPSSGVPKDFCRMD